MSRAHLEVHTLDEFARSATGRHGTRRSPAQQGSSGARAYRSGSEPSTDRALFPRAPNRGDDDGGEGTDHRPKSPSVAEI